MVQNGYRFLFILSVSAIPSYSTILYYSQQFLTLLKDSRARPEWQVFLLTLLLSNFITKQGCVVGYGNHSLKVLQEIIITKFTYSSDFILSEKKTIHRKVFHQDVKP